MPPNPPDQEWKKGSAELLVLSLLEDQPRHGYDISKLIQIRSGGALRFHVTSLYPLLHRLEKQGWIEGRWVEKAEQRRRRYYSLTPQGKKCFVRSGRAGRISSPSSAGSQESNMPDWKRSVRERIAPLRLTATAESDLAEELAQHLEDRYRELRSGGASEEEAYRKAISELDDMYPLRAGLERNQRMPKYDAVPAGDGSRRQFHGRSLARSSLCRPHHAEKPPVRSVRGSDAGLGDWREHHRFHRDQHADLESAAGPGFLRAGCGWRGKDGEYVEIGRALAASPTRI